MIFYFTRCELCGITYQVLGRPEQLRLLDCNPEWKLSFPCVESRCLGRAVRMLLAEVHANGLPSKEVPFSSYYRALFGFGSPNGGPADAKTVNDLLVTQRVVSAKLFPTGEPERTILQMLTLEDGTRLHFEASDLGACVFMVERSTPLAPQ